MDIRKRRFLYLLPGDFIRNRTPCLQRTPKPHAFPDVPDIGKFAYLFILLLCCPLQRRIRHHAARPRLAQHIRIYLAGGKTEYTKKSHNRKCNCSGQNHVPPSVRIIFFLCNLRYDLFIVIFHFHPSCQCNAPSPLVRRHFVGRHS